MRVLFAPFVPVFNKRPIVIQTAGDPLNYTDSLDRQVESAANRCASYVTNCTLNSHTVYVPVHIRMRNKSTDRSGVRPTREHQPENLQVQ